MVTRNLFALLTLPNHPVPTLNLSYSTFFLSYVLFWAAAPKGPMTYALTHMGDFLLLLLLLLLLLRPPPPQGPNPSPEAQILVWKLKSQP